ncbi:hypothetical protein [Paenibacillus odorifer]|uniref:hypothetical protein n=1 Tax=Paenibacillus odorifer TaxID=189426 RepID=UPI00096D6109|nr:hypothetical protein [Paenibacillus odorifer]OME41443.1 hypothetical protein BSK58_15035 [Paenibacillus odorifer]
MISNSGLSALIDILSEINKKDREIQNVFESSGADILSKYSEKLQDWILTELGVPEDNTVEMLKKHGDPEGYFIEETFCRDFITDSFFEFNEGNLTKDELLFNLQNWNEKLDELKK